MADNDPPVTAPARGLTRRPDDGPLAGVAAGIGAALGIDPVLVRLAFVALTFLWGAGAVLYLVCWLLLPPQDADGVRGEPLVTLPADLCPPGSVQRWLCLGLIGVAVLWPIGALVGGPALWGILLLAGGILLFRSEPARHEAPDGREAPADPAPADPVATTAEGMTPAGPAVTVRPQRAEPAPRRRRHSSFLGRLTLGVLLVVGGGLALLDGAGLLDLTLRHYSGVTWLVLGAGLVVGAWWGRGRGLLALGLLLVPVVALAAVAGPSWDSGMTVGDRSYAPGGLEQLREGYDLLAGRLSLDLSRVDLAGREAVVTVRTTFGEQVITVPAGATVEVDARAGVGTLVLPGPAGEVAARTGRLERTGGVAVRRRVLLEGTTGSGRLVLRLRVATGQVVVRRAG